MDQYEVNPSEGWPRWMDRKIRESKLVLLICTERYLSRVNGTEKDGTCLGVRWEGSLIYQHLYDAASTNTRFIPVIFAKRDEQYIPTALCGATRYWLGQRYRQRCGTGDGTQICLDGRVALCNRTCKSGHADYCHCRFRGSPRYATGHVLRAVVAVVSSSCELQSRPDSDRWI
jgi:hypothetical protein